VIDHLISRCRFEHRYKVPSVYNQDLVEIRVAPPESDYLPLVCAQLGLVLFELVCSASPVQTVDDHGITDVVCNRPVPLSILHQHLVAFG